MEATFQVAPSTFQGILGVDSGVRKRRFRHHKYANVTGRENGGGVGTSQLLA